MEKIILFGNFFKPYITSQIDKGNIERDFFAAFEDEYNISRSGKQRFGTKYTV